MASTTSAISFYGKINDINSNESIPADLFFVGIEEGTWEDIVNEVRLGKRDKRTLPSVTLSGKFSVREDDKLQKHSGLIGMDIDECDVNAIKEQLRDDKYLYAAFVTCRGKGLCLVFKINPARHKDAFKGLSKYLYDNYKIVADPTSINQSRARFVSYDPNCLRFEERAEKFLHYPKDKPPKKVDKILFAESDFEEILGEIQRRRLNLCENYYEWLRIGFAIASKFGEQGRRYFHLLSQYSTKYDADGCDKQYNVIAKRQSHSGITISTFYWYAKTAGLSVYSERTKTIAHVAAQGKRSGLTVEAVAENLRKHEGIVNAEELIRQIFDDNIELNEDTLIDQLEMYMRHRYEMRRNVITRYIECNGQIITQKDLNSIFLKAKKVLDKISYELVDRLINSDFVEDYNPILDFFANNIEREPKGVIDKFWGCIKTKDTEYAKKFGKKWMVGCIASAHGTHNPLYPVLSGRELGTGKTEYWRRMLPDELKDYYAESKLNSKNEKDDHILMTQRWIIMDDEMGGKSKKEDIHIRELCSKQYFDLREPYGKNNVKLIRLCNFGGTTNENEIVASDMDNRRFIPIHVYEIDNDTYNEIDKVDLWMEAYHLYKSGFDWQVKRSEMAELNKDKISFETVIEEKELVVKYFKHGQELMTCTEIKVFLENVSRQKLTVAKLGRVMQQLKFEQEHVNLGFTTKRCYKVERLFSTGNLEEPPF